MTLTRAEKRDRGWLETVFADLPKPKSEDTALIRERLIEEFTAHLDSKIVDLQDGEAILAIHRIEIMNPDGTIRRGKFRDRNMPAYRSWRQDVFDRDQFTCQHCGKVREGIEAHHIRPWGDYAPGRFDVSNGITLCSGCHKREHARMRLEGQ